MSAYVSYTSFPVADLGEESGKPGAPLFWMKKEEMTEGRKAGGASKIKPPPSPAPHVAQGLDPPLANY